MSVRQSHGVHAPHTPDLEASEKPSFLQTAVFLLMKSGLSSRAWRRMGNVHTTVRHHSHYTGILEPHPTRVHTNTGGLRLHAVACDQSGLLVTDPKVKYICSKSTQECL